MKMLEAKQLDAGTVSKLRKDLRQAAGLMTREEARYVVDLYYQIQEFRKATANQVLSMKKEPTNILEWSFASMETIESEIKHALDKYTDQEATGMGKWAKSITGIGPVLSAGLLAYIDLDPWKCVKDGKHCIERDPHDDGLCKRQRIRTVGSVWRFAGLDPTVTWNKGQKRPWNAQLKVLCWKIGQSFVKVSNNPKSQYGALYRERKQFEVGRSAAGELADQAKASLEAKKFGRDTKAFAAYEKGELPAARLDLRATRWTVKIFLYHWTAEYYRRKFGEELPKPYVIEHLGHAHFIEATEAVQRD